MNVPRTFPSSNPTHLQLLAALPTTEERREPMKRIREEELRPFEIQPLTDEVLANLSIEELEERLEMQILHVSEAQWCLIDFCGVDCGTLCGANCGTNCA